MTPEPNLTDDVIKKSGLFEPMFNDVVTLDPAYLEEAWDKLSIDTHKSHLQSFSKILALAFYLTALESGAVNATTQKIEKATEQK